MATRPTRTNLHAFGVAAPTPTTQAPHLGSADLALEIALPVGTTAIVYCQGQLGEQDGKTGNGLVRHSEKYQVLSVIDSSHAGADAGTVLSKPQRPWGRRAQTAFGARDEGEPSAVAPEPGGATNRQAILAIGRQDIDPEGLHLPDGITLVGASSDHLLLNLGDHRSAVGDEISFGVGYGALLRAMTSPHVAHVEHLEVPAVPLG